MQEKQNDISEQQSQTADSFGFKWGKRDTYESDVLKDRTQKWLFEMFCGGDAAKVDEWLAGGPKTILDAGCGAGYSALLLFGQRLAGHNYTGVDISEAVHVAAKRFAECGLTGHFLQCDLMATNIPEASVDIVFSPGVLHHTDSVRDSILSLSRKLKPSGLFLFYVYSKKSVLREFTDDYIREHLQAFSNEEAWERLRPLTKLGQALGELKVVVDIPEDIPFLGIPKGSIDIQRLFHWHICKMFYDQGMDIEEMNHINFDWFHPLNCIRSTPEEVREYCEQAGLVIERIDIQDSGIAVVARKLQASTSRGNNGDGFVSRVRRP